MLREKNSAVLLIAITFVMLNLSCIPVLISPISEEFGITDSESGSIVFLFMIGYFLGALFYTIFSRFFRLTILYYIYFPILAICYAGIYFAESFLIIEILRFVSGFFSAAMVPFTLNHVSQNTRSHGKKVGALFSVSTSSGILGTLLAGILSWRYLFLIPALSFLLLFLFVAVVRPQRHIPVSGVPETAPPIRLNTVPGNLVLLCLYILLLKTLSMALSTWIGPFYKASFQFSKGMISIIYFVMNGASIIGSLIAGYLMDRISHHKSLLLIGVIYPLFFVLFLISGNQWPLLLLSALLFGITRQGLHTALVTMLLKNNPSFRKFSSGMNSIVVFLGNSLGSFIIVHWVKYYPFEKILLLFLAFYVLLYLSLLFKGNTIFKGNTAQEKS